MTGQVMISSAGTNVRVCENVILVVEGFPQINRSESSKARQVHLRQTFLRWWGAYCRAGLSVVVRSSEHELFLTFLWTLWPDFENIMEFYICTPTCSDRAMEAKTKAPHSWSSQWYPVHGLQLTWRKVGCTVPNNFSSLPGLTSKQSTSIERVVFVGWGPFVLIPLFSDIWLIYIV